MTFKSLAPIDIEPEVNKSAFSRISKNSTYK